MPKVIVAMSGGVDSFVAAAILKNDLSALGGGYDVVGVFMRMHKNSNPKDAKIVAKKIGINFKIIDVQKEFKKRVINYFINEYKKGNTPNPCVECNQHIKFRFLIEMAMKLKADFIATGHYARIKKGKLFVAKDKQKDQSYFLWILNKKQLNKILFPIGDYTKDEVRKMAKEFDLSVSEKKDSQDVCFAVPRQSFQAKVGPIITTKGKKIGEHKGLIFYTIGQRKKIEVGGIGPYYVIQKDFKNNTLIVSKLEKDLLQKEMIVKNTNWISGKPFSGKCKIKIRSTAKAVPARVMKYESRIKNCVKVIFNAPQRAITSGQSAVFYKGNKVLGGGVIM